MAVRVMGKMMVMLEMLRVVITSPSLDPALEDIFTRQMDWWQTLKVSRNWYGHLQ